MHDDMQDELDSLVPAQSFSRRDFMATALGGAFALAVQPVMAQSTITTDLQGIQAGTVEVPVNDGVMKAYCARPKVPAHKGRLPIILVVSEIFGVHAYIADVTRRLAKLGYLAVAPDLFARQGDTAAYATVAEIQRNVIAKVPDIQVKADLDDVVSWAGRNGGNLRRLGITGFCWGGRITWLYASYNPLVKAGVAWYGRLRGDVTLNNPRHPLDVADHLYGPVLGLYGGKDQGIPLTDVEAMNTRLAASGTRSRIHVYPDAPHAFHADYRPSYRQAEADDAWQRMRQWFAHHRV